LNKLDIGKLGRVYLAGLWLGVIALFLVGGGKWIFEQSGTPFGRTDWNTVGMMLCIVLLHTIAAWSVLRQLSWGYYLSLAISACWVIDAVYDFFAIPLTAAPRWSPAIPLVLGTVALIWLVSPALRSQFSLASRKTRVV
jgi:hypothetical protein